MAIVIKKPKTTNQKKKTPQKNSKKPPETTQKNMTLGHQYTKKAASRDFFTNITLALKITASKRTLVSMGYYTVKVSNSTCSSQLQTQGKNSTTISYFIRGF